MLLVNAIVVIATPEHFVWLAGVATAFGIGLTTTVAVEEGPVQPLAVAVIVNVTVTGALVVLVSVPLISPLPLAAIPVTEAVLFLVQLNDDPVVVLDKFMGVIELPEHIVWLEGVLVTTGDGLINTVAVIGVPVQPFAAGVIVKVTVIGAAVVFVSVPVIFPLPLAAMPVTETVLSLVQV